VRANATAEKFNLLLDPNAATTDWAQLLEIVEGRDTAHWLGLAVEMVLGISAGYKRRVLMRTRRYPLLLMWLVWSPPSVECDERKKCASDLLDSARAGNIGDETTEKLLFVFRRAIVLSARTGRLDDAEGGSDLYKLLIEVSIMWASRAGKQTCSETWVAVLFSADISREVWRFGFADRKSCVSPSLQ
jgi:hypothetical protein